MFSVSFIENRFYENLKTFFKKPKDFIFSLKNLGWKHNIHIQTVVLRQIEWGVQNGLLIKNGALTLTTLSIWKFNFIITSVYVMYQPPYLYFS